jgi:LCP family protein required for cell wall assembly
MNSGVQNKRRGKRLLNFLLFRIIPVLLILGAVWIGIKAAQSAAQRINDQTQAEQRHPSYVATATGIADSIAEMTLNAPPTQTPQVAVPSDRMLVGKPEIRLRLAQFETNTPQGDVDLGLATNTLLPLPTETAVPATPIPDVTNTPRPVPTIFIYGEAPADASAPTAIPSPVPAIDRRGMDLMNILLMGNDGELTEDGFIRTDTMIVVSINRGAGTVSMLSLPRDLYVYIPGWTMQRLNLAYIRGESVGWTDGGFGLMRQTIFYNLGINVHYYAMVSLEGFKAIVDTVGTVSLTVDCAIQDLPLIGADVPSGAVRINEDGEYVLPVGAYEMTGGEALWYARSRTNSSDFDRGRRQQQVLRAVWRQARANGLLTSLPQLWNEGIQYVETNLTLEDLISLVPLAGSLDPSRIESFVFRRLYHTTPWTPPDGSNVQLPNSDAVRELMTDFYSPATESQINSEGASVRVYNGTANANWDLVAADRLGWDGVNAIPMGTADNPNYTDTILIDYTGREKGSSMEEIARTLNVRPENIRSEPNPNREADFEVILGANYNSCTEAGVLPVDEGE